MNAPRVFLISSVLLFIITLGATAQDKYIPKADEEIYGTWISANLAQTQFQKYVLRAEVMKRYSLLSDSTPSDEATYEIDAKWTDSEGNIWYKTHGIQTSGVWKDYTYVELDRLNKAGTIWEGQFSPLGYKGKIDPMLYPKEFDRKSSYHGFSYRYRAEE